MISASTVTSTQLTFPDSSAYTNYAIYFQAEQSYAASTYMYGIFTYSHSDKKYHAFYYMSYGSSKFYCTNNTKEDEVKRSGDVFTINSSYSGLGLNWITNTSQGKYIGFFW